MSGKAAEALADCDKAFKLCTIQDSPQSKANAYYMRGLCQRELGNFPPAIADLTEAIRLLPQFGRAYLTRSKVYAALGEDALFQADMQQVELLRRDPPLPYLPRHRQEPSQPNKLALFWRKP